MVHLMKKNVLFALAMCMLLATQSPLAKAVAAATQPSSTSPLFAEEAKLNATRYTYGQMSPIIKPATQLAAKPVPPATRKIASKTIAPPAIYYGPTKKTDHLYRIALKTRPSSHLSVEQTMLAIFDANPNAFRQHNINGLKPGVQLVIPSAAQMNTLSKRDALLAIQEQNSAWSRGHKKA